MIAGRQWVVTGASRGIGRGLVTRLLARGARVVATARGEGDVRELSGQNSDGRLEVVRVDVTRDDDVAALAAKIGERGVDVLINNAGMADAWAGLDDMSFDEAGAVYEVNAISPLRVTRALLPALRRGSGKLVAHMTSRMGSIGDNSSGGSYAYRMSKAALNMASKCLSIDLAPDGIASVALHPGWVRTDMGGPGAPVSIDESVEGLLRVLSRPAAQLNGKLLDHRGLEIAW